ncbi:MAG TPA: zf-HC2 domain-containing protein [Methylomirabilota bacterium]|jgi:anti-sigma factor RsiW
MKDVHVDELLIDHVRGDLAEPERSRVAAHLAVCAECRATRERFTALLGELERTAPAPPPVHWGAYRAELRDRLERRGGAGPVWGWLLRPASALVAAALVSALVMAGRPGLLHGPGAPDPLALDNTILASQLDMIARLDVVQQLDLLEDFNVINELDELPGPSKS